MLKILIFCEDCNRCYEIKSDRNGQMVYMDEIPVNMEIKWEVTNTSELEEMDEIDDGDVQVECFKIIFTCPECGKYISIEQ